MRRLASLVFLIAAASTAAAQTPAQQARFDSAYFAWEDGNYPVALARFERLLRDTLDGPIFRERIALLTGELYHTVPINPEGLDLRWASAAPVAAFSVKARRASQIIAVEGDGFRNVARVDGVGLALSPDGSHAAYLMAPETSELVAARARFDSLVGARDFRAANQQLRVVQRLERELSKLILRDLRSGREVELRLPPMGKWGLSFAPNGRDLYLVGTVPGDTTRADIFALEDVTGSATLRPIVEGPGIKEVLFTSAGGFLVYSIGPNIHLRNLGSGATQTFPGQQPAMAAGGTLLTWVQRSPMETVVMAIRPGEPEPRVLKRSPRPMATPVPSPDGSRVAFALMPREDWEVYVVDADGRNELRVTRDIQHDRNPRWVDGSRLLAMKGEPRHTRAHLYDLRDGSARRLHHNNTVRTVAPEYDWAVSPDGTRVLVVADRDGDTISPERGVYLVNLEREVSDEQLLSRVRASLAAERALRARGARMFAATQGAIRAAVRDVSVARIYDYARALYEFDSKFITQPGNRKAIEYLAATLRQWGYEPELQWFEPRPGVRTANVIATLKGTTNPELVYVVSSHFDSVEPGPGADDNSSGTTALLEAARVLATRPQAATIRFAFFTGEEAGLLGSREFVRRAVALNERIVGALNNDMIGWANDHRLDNTIRYSNDGLRDLQHAAAFTFTDLITYDARYYQNTDAHAYYEAYGDIVGGIGSYPILGNPHYHQPHDILATINHRLVAEVSRTTVASIMQMASSPSRLTAIDAREAGSGARVTWDRAPEKGVARYVVTYGPASNPTLRRVVTTTPAATLTGARAGWQVAVKAVDARGVEGWDWARGVVRAEDSARGAFWDALQALCGKSYAGVVTQSVPPDTLFSRETLVMHVRECGSSEVRIPFHVGANRSRTWIITRTADGFRLKHDHRHEDGSPDSLTMYGGDTKDPGTAVFQDFHADAHTASLIPAAATNVWTVEIVPGDRFVYALRRVGTDRVFRATFNLRHRVEDPPPPWGTRR